MIEYESPVAKAFEAQGFDVLGFDAFIKSGPQYNTIARIDIESGLWDVSVIIDGPMLETLGQEGITTVKISGLPEQIAPAVAKRGANLIKSIIEELY